MFLANLVENFALNQFQYKRLSLEGSEWSEFISKTIDYKIKSIVECGAVCAGFGQFIQI